jgi:hypothetical protein
VKFILQRVRLNSGGYDSSGSYWGVGLPVYWFCDNDCKAGGFFRARNRKAAKEHVRGTHPDARFYS